MTRALRELIAADMQDLYGWTVSPADIVFLPGVVPGFNQALKAVTRPGDRLVVETPVYPPILAASSHWDLARVDVPVRPVADGSGVDGLWTWYNRFGRADTLRFQARVANIDSRIGVEEESWMSRPVVPTGGGATAATSAEN